MSQRVVKPSVDEGFASERRLLHGGAANALVLYRLNGRLRYYAATLNQLDEAARGPQSFTLPEPFLKGSGAMSPE